MSELMLSAKRTPHWINHQYDSVGTMQFSDGSSWKFVADHGKKKRLSAVFDLSRWTSAVSEMEDVQI